MTNLIAKITFETLSARVNAIAHAEKITKHELSLLSREVLAFVLETEDIRIVNTLLGKGEDGKYILTSNNRRVAGLYFKEFMPFSNNGGKELDQVVFIKKKAKVWDKYAETINNWLADETNDLWKWAGANVQMEPKAKMYGDKITKLVTKALDDEVEGLNSMAIIDAVMAGGVTIDDLLALVTAVYKEAA